MKKKGKQAKEKEKWIKDVYVGPQEYNTNQQQESFPPRSIMLQVTQQQQQKVEE